jgi:serine/threonine protein kinase
MVEPVLDTPGYELIQPPFGEGAYGKVWLARNRSGQWRAVKVVYLSKFHDNHGPYEREFNGIQKYMPISRQHPGLLRVDFVSEKNAEFFYYVMELGDSIVAGWEHDPGTYKPRDLDNERAKIPGRRLPVMECVRIGVTICEALDFIHGRGMTHRDIKPPNIIFVNNQPKLADLGLITDLRPTGETGTLVGTPGYMPPPPERPGTASADIYALGMVLYVLSTGRSAALFPEIATTLVNTGDSPQFLALNAIILTACEPLPENRYATAAQMRLALEELMKNG